MRLANRLAAIISATVAFCAFDALAEGNDQIKVSAIPLFESASVYVDYGELSPRDAKSPSGGSANAGKINIALASIGETTADQASAIRICLKVKSYGKGSR